MERPQGLANQEAQEEHSPSLKVFCDGRPVFFSSGRWLYPLFELEEFLRTADVVPARCRIEDKIIGKAAAFLIINMGFRTVYGGTMSRLAEAVFAARGVQFTFGRMVERVDCQTESLLAGIEDVEEACRMLRHRAGMEKTH